MRADFYGPDGLPVASLRCDSTGALIYLPDDRQATYYPGGFPLGDALVGCRDILGLVRTGFPLRLPQWVMVEGGALETPLVVWSLESRPGGTPAMSVVLSPGSLFPALRWPGGSLEVTSAGPGDVFEAWPTSWQLAADGNQLSLNIRAIRTPDTAPDPVWTLQVPVPVDTVRLGRRWDPAWRIPRR